MKKKRDLLLNRKIGSHPSSILPEFVDCSVQIYNGKTHVRCKITEGGHKFGEFASTRKRRSLRTNIGPGIKKGKKSSLSAYGTKRKSNFVQIQVGSVRATAKVAARSDSTEYGTWIAELGGRGNQSISSLFLKEYHYTKLFGDEPETQRERKTIREKANQTDQLVPVNCQYELASANKKIDLINPSCPPTKHLLDEDVNKLVKGEESDDNQFANDMVLRQEDPDTRINLGNYKESPKENKVIEYVYVDEEVEDQTAEVVLIRRNGKGSLEINDTPLATPTRSPRNESLSLDKEKHKELTSSKPSSSLSKSKYDHSRHLRGVDAFLRNYMNNNILYVHPTTSASYFILDLRQQLYLKMKDDEQERNANFPLWLALMYKFEKSSSHEPCRVDAFCRKDHEDHHDNDARPKGRAMQKGK
nr:ribosomal protein S19, mitochondrial [Tanacetum cinerariifolium]